ncbi:MAG: hypothetical protein HYY90_05030 [Candidatus Omnitrophica bacterium]|nr:hypothetical protein [Candidatus Omnitrophota bacterium]MBI3020777.1 hypothetical protein [Candidatus Omnitrophota bacterium]MBI3083707.1 hypothetical protein [Candidatus Omnitrophota bacterium]
MKNGQAIIEYTILIGIITAALLGMQTYTKRSLQAGIKAMADRLSPYPNDPRGERAQRAGIRYESRDRQDRVVAAGTVLERQSKTRAVSRQMTNTRLLLDGRTRTTTLTDTTRTEGALDPNLGGRTLGPNVSDYSEVVGATPKEVSIQPPPAGPLPLPRPESPGSSPPPGSPFLGGPPSFPGGPPSTVQGGD